MRSAGGRVGSIFPDALNPTVALKIKKRGRQYARSWPSELQHMPFEILRKNCEKR